MSDEGPRAGWCYCLSNPRYPEFKIGFSGLEDPLERVKKINGHEGVPIPYTFEFAFKYSDAQNVEKNLHKLAAAWGRKVGKEFFENISLENLKLLFTTQNPIEEYNKMTQVKTNVKSDKIINEIYMFHGQKVWRTNYKEIVAIWLEDRNQYQIEGTNEYMNKLVQVDKYVVNKLNLQIQPSSHTFDRYSTEIDGKEVKLKHYIEGKKETKLKEETDDESYESENSGGS